MANAILVHGWGTEAEFFDLSHPTPSNSHWFPWLSKQLAVNGIHTVSLEMPEAYYPVYETWKRELERYDIDENTILVGHSCGGGFLIRWLSENDIKVGKVFLVAPWLGYDVNEEPFDKSFFDFEMRRDIAQKTRSLHVIVSDDDVAAIHDSVRDIVGGIDEVKVRKLSGKGHFTLNSLGGEEFPELLEEIMGG